ncbi:ribosomal RNA small subunit methyltransferase A [Erysipelothrix sp. HDW6C]|uniref:16S rRNA (adenine(1518)-N(6)/adenine(1519)-N(6))- dimethyltransferase RsmA n=1 Tax=Erysipelothrix sp. HDW6C TaxID=2714930 RepID=UPI001408E462|nr:16S rRNA (adenine(1518)-N(6)/adenine(1519)-N(6))-dimethyltransferase RsmA [Erysipelothrix sp. HDW6C]QIK69030.1 ribosomal RNA small subunit methyltransferase A [Erysipelothrix sp. HDW6C]
MKTIANYSVSMEILKRYERRAKKHFGQNFMIDPSVVRNIATYSGEGGTVLEIGPGLGALTQQLAERYDRVIAYEIDPHMVEILKETLEDYDNVEIIYQDFLKADLSAFKEPITICANLPYYITTPILFKLMELDIIAMTILVQKEISDRLTAHPQTKEYSALSIQMQYYFDIKTVMKVSKESFHPRPNVESSVIKFVPREHSLPYDEQTFFTFVKKCFQFRRKTLVNNLKTIDKEVNYAEILESLGLDPSIRADYLTLDDYVRLYGALYA